MKLTQFHVYLAATWRLHADWLSPRPQDEIDTEEEPGTCALTFHQKLHPAAASQSVLTFTSICKCRQIYTNDFGGVGASFWFAVKSQLMLHFLSFRLTCYLAILSFQYLKCTHEWGCDHVFWPVSMFGWACSCYSTKPSFTVEQFHFPSLCMIRAKNYVPSIPFKAQKNLSSQQHIIWKLMILHHCPGWQAARAALTSFC